MVGLFRSLLLITATLFFVAASPLHAQVFPIQISADGRTLVDQNGDPFFINGDTAWSLIGQLSREDADLYLADCAAKGFNSVVVTLVEGYFADNAPANFYNVQPFTTPNDFTTPNEEYFAHADYVINKAAEYGIQVVLAPNYLGCCNDGWYAALRDDNSVADAQFFGNYIGTRYRDFPNIIYVWGNDLDPGDVRSKIRAMAQAASDADPNHLHTYHGEAEQSALDAWSASESWLDINISYTYEAVQNKVLQDYNRTPFLPFFLFESQYEADFLNASPLQTRKQAYTAVLSGANGHHYGNWPVWHMNGKPGDDSFDWRDALEYEGRTDMQHVRTLFESRAWHTLVPDQNHNVLVSGFGTGQQYVAAALTSDATTFIAYFPRQRQVSIDFDQLSGAQRNGWWFNPRDGSSTAIDAQGLSGMQSLTPPSSGDWVLVVDDAAAGYPAPGEIVVTVQPNPPSNLQVR